MLALFVSMRFLTLVAILAALIAGNAHNIPTVWAGVGDGACPQGQQVNSEGLCPIQTATPVVGVAAPVYLFGSNLLLQAWADPSLQSGQPVKLNTASGGSNQKWTFNSDGSITTAGSQAGTALCLDSSHLRNVPQYSNQLIVYACATGNENQQWTWHPESSTLENTNSGWCLDAQVNGVGSAIQVGLAQCSSSRPGQFMSWGSAVFPPSPAPAIGTPYMRISLFGTNTAIRMMTTNRSPVILMTYAGFTDELWSLDSDGTISNSGFVPRMCLDGMHVSNGLYPQNQVMVFDCSSSGTPNPNQLWTWRADSTIENTGTGWCLNGATINAQPTLVPCNANSPTQHFTQYRGAPQST